MRHILIDYENVQPKNFKGFSNKPCHIWLFLGVHQQRHLPLELVESLLAFDSNKVHIIKMCHQGKNALDFYLSFYLGKISEIDDSAEVCIWARDSGYDVLIDHVNLLHDGINITRVSTLGYEDIFSDDDYKDVIKSLNLIDIDNCKNEHNSSSSTSITKLISENSYDTQSFITPTLVQQCHIKVLDTLLENNAVLPKDKQYLKSCLKKLIVSNYLSEHTSTQQDEVVEQVIEKLIKQGIIEFDSCGDTVCYYVTKQEVCKLIGKRVLKNRAKNIDGLHKIIKQNLNSYRQSSGDEDIKQMVNWLKRQNIIRQNNKNICYPSLQSNQLNKTELSDSHKNQKQLQKNESSLYQLVISSLKQRPESSRPTKKSSLKNYLTSQFRQDTSHNIDNTVKQLIANKVIVVSGSQKLSYNL